MEKSDTSTTGGKNVKKPSKTVNSSKKMKTGPMVYRNYAEKAIKFLSESSGSTMESILKYILKECDVKQGKKSAKEELQKAIKKGVTVGQFQIIDGPPRKYRLGSKDLWKEKKIKKENRLNNKKLNASSLKSFAILICKLLSNKYINDF